MPTIKWTPGALKELKRATYRHGHATPGEGDVFYGCRAWEPAFDVTMVRERRDDSGLWHPRVRPRPGPCPVCAGGEHSPPRPGSRETCGGCQGCGLDSTRLLSGCITTRPDDPPVNDEAPADADSKPSKKKKAGPPP